MYCMFSGGLYEVRNKIESLMCEVQIFWHLGQVKSTAGISPYSLGDFCVLTSFVVFVVN